MSDDLGFPFLWEAMARREIRHDPAVLDDDRHDGVRQFMER
jgi:hypothetical protein